MRRLAIIVPTRGRPQNVERLVKLNAPYVDWYFCVDRGDDAADDYVRVTGGDEWLDGVTLIIGKPQRLVPWLNETSAVLAEDGYDQIGFIGDDHLPRTEGWDQRIVDTLEQMGTGIVYTNDLLQGEKLPTVAFMTSDIITTLGYMAPPDLQHMYVDDFWLDIGRAIDRITYLDDVVIEHMHPLAGKANMDASYETTAALFRTDGVAYAHYKAEQFSDDVARVEALLYA